ncbi:MAG: hypothetical protein HKO77_03260 [Gemmatimonadetes bacterium]|nr:hypothetical protein [Gemmatimonadota bacterium]
MSIYPAIRLATISWMLGLAGGAGASAQVATGLVTDESTGVPVPGAEISLLDGSRDVGRRAVSDATGRYTIEAPAPGAYWVTADFLGYTRLESPLLNLEVERTVVVDFELPVDAIELEGLQVEAERDRELRERLRLYGVRPEALGARWLRRTEIERWPTAEDFGVALRAQAIASVQVSRGVERGGRPSVCVSYRRGGCALIVWNGTPVTPETAALIPPTSLESVVVLTPMEATLSYGTDGGNGAVLLFSIGASPGR